METCVTESFDVAESQEVEMQETVSSSDKDQEPSGPPSDEDGSATDNKENVSVDGSFTYGGGGKIKESSGRKGDCYW